MKRIPLWIANILLYTAGKFPPDFAERVVIMLSDFVETRGVRTPPLEGIPGCVRPYGEHLLGKERTRLRRETLRSACVARMQVHTRVVISRPREFPPFARSPRRRDNDDSGGASALRRAKRASWESDWLATLNNVVNATTEIRNLLNFLRSARVSPATHLRGMTEGNSYETSLLKQSLPALSSAC